LTSTPTQIRSRYSHRRTNFTQWREALEKAGLAIAHFGSYRGFLKIRSRFSGHPAEQVLKLMEDLEDHDDVQGVAANFDISDEEMAHFSAA